MRRSEYFITLTLTNFTANKWSHCTHRAGNTALKLMRWHFFIFFSSNFNRNTAVMIFEMFVFLKTLWAVMENTTLKIRYKKGTNFKKWENLELFENLNCRIFWIARRRQYPSDREGCESRIQFLHLEGCLRIMLISSLCYWQLFSWEKVHSGENLREMFWFCKLQKCPRGSLSHWWVLNWPNI